MAEARIPIFDVEVIATQVPIAALFLQNVEVAASRDADNSGQVRIPYFNVEAIAEVPPMVHLQLQNVEVAANPDVANSGQVRIPIFGIEVLAQGQSSAQLLLQNVEVAANINAGFSGQVRIPIFGLEIISDTPATVTPLDFPADYSFFLHNWADEVRMTTAWETDISDSADEVSEDRLSIRDKPIRSLTPVWLVSSRERAVELTNHLRRFSRNRLPLPFYQEQVPLEVSIGGTPTNEIFCDTTDRRYFPGQRILLAELSRQDDSFTGTFLPRQILQRFPEKLIIDTNVSNLSKERYFVFPLMDCETMLEVRYFQKTNFVYQVEFTAQEVIGKSAIPPVQTGDPDGYQFFEDFPIWVPDHNWKDNPEIGFIREGEITQSGKGVIVSPRGERHRVHHKFDMLLERPEFYKFLRIFDTSRGRAKQFWMQDYEDLWIANAIDASGQFVDIAPIGDFDEFQNELGPPGSLGHVGLVFRDGKTYVREVANITVAGNSWRLTMLTNLPTNLVVGNLLRVSRARRTRFNKDVIEEHWATTEVVRLKAETVELLAEDEYLIA